MTERVRVFLVDDSAAVRSILTQVLEEDSRIDVVGTAPDGAEGLKRLRKVSADILVLDIEMPGMGGLEMLKQLKQDGSTMPVVVFSSMTERGAMVTIEALSLGASDYVTKPAMVGSPNAARDYIRSTLLEKIHQLIDQKKGRARSRGKQEKPKSTSIAPPKSSIGKKPFPARHTTVSRSSFSNARVDAVVIGVSMGGPQALRKLVCSLPANIPVPILIVQHMPALFTKALAASLTKESPVPVRECEGEQELDASCIWLARGDFHMLVRRKQDRTVVYTEMSEPVNFCRPSVDKLFVSAAAVWGRHLLGVVMTGMGSDGLDGARKIRELGGDVLVQDEASSVVWGMPGRVSEAGLASGEISLDELGPAIMKRISRSPVSHSMSAS